MILKGGAGLRKSEAMLVLFFAVPVVMLGGFALLIVEEGGNIGPHTPANGGACGRPSWPAPRIVNHTSAIGPPSGISSSDFPGLTSASNVSVRLAPMSPLTVATNTSGWIYGIFAGTGGYRLSTSSDLVYWTNISSSVVPGGYQVAPGDDLAVTDRVILVSATRLSTHLNSTVFTASFDNGRNFQTVLNITLKALPETFTNLSTGPGYGFWHGVAETANGYLFAGLYNPQGLIFRSEDGGINWQLVFNASSRSDWHNEIHDLEVNPYNGYLYTTTDDEAGTGFNQSIWVSTDYANHWTLLYSASGGGSGLPLHLTPTTIGFMDEGREVVLGFEGWYKSNYARSLYLMDAEPNGCLQVAVGVSASNIEVDPFISWWMYPTRGDSLFVLTHENTPTPTLGVGLFVLGKDGSLTTYMTLSSQDSQNWFGTGFLQMTGPSASGAYGVLALADGRTHFLEVNFPADP